jgi:hypothetical protein
MMVSSLVSSPNELQTAGGGLAPLQLAVVIGLTERSTGDEENGKPQASRQHTTRSTYEFSASNTISS